jgi:probable rRNA maturation factor
MPVSQKAAPPVFEVEIVEDDGDWSRVTGLDNLIDEAARAAVLAAGERAKPVFVSVALSSDANVALLNERFRNKSKPTNVLSFPAGASAPEGQLGDIVMAFETLEREAQEQDVPFEHHLQHLVVHGMLHLLGYDHETTADAECMEAIEIAVLSKLGVANPYTGALETGKSD